ncbi:single-stranded DNA-binding protein [Lactococcus lactis]|uniref:single-stranded DNA-binding protein n=1 Tax=Lactococcus lactis TaxID=1358 RepID=UPI0028602D9E|nr:single-stranded DNA-binding protein [Lactococcus lactis]MDR7695793.1 single-stranded DNA-binding protein [Lactococcus lactis]
MQYNRNNVSSLGGKQFEAGVHIAKITKVEAGKSRTNKEMFKFTLEGPNGESTIANLLFGESWTESNLQRILASIEDNGQQIAPIDYGYNRETVQFLTNHKVFIRMKERTGTYTDRNGEVRNSTGTEHKAFLTHEEYMKFGGGAQQTNIKGNTAQGDPFGNSAPMNISDEDLPF